MKVLSKLTHFSGFGAVGERGLRSRSGKLQGSSLRRCGLDRHHGDHHGHGAAILKGLGYSTDIKVLSVPVTYTSLRNKDIDVFLGNWMPTMEADIKPYLEDKSVEPCPKPDGAKYTLAVPQYLYDAGLKDFTDIAKFKDELDGKIYGIEPGNDGNRLILDMIDEDEFGLKGFELVESLRAGHAVAGAKDRRAKSKSSSLAGSRIR